MKQLVFIIIFIACYLFNLSYTCLAVSTTAEDLQQQANGTITDDLQKQINSTNSQIEALDKEIKQYQEQIAQTSEQSATLANLIKELTLTRSKLIKEKEQTEKKIKSTNLIINVLDNNISSKKESINKSKESLSKMLRDLYNNDQILLIEKLLSQNNLSSISQEYNNLLSLNENLRNHIKDVELQKGELSISKTQKELEQQKLTKLKKTLVQKQQAVEITKKEKNAVLVETKNKEANYKKLLAEQKKKRDAFEKDLLNYESQLKFILDPKALPKEGSGVLSWPVENVLITQLFGITSASKRLYKSGSHSGVDFRASIGTPVMSMGSGMVMGTGDTDQYCRGASFGKWVFIKYDDGLSSVFGHLSQISATVGQQVNTGDTVALSGNTGHSTGPHLHVTVYASGGAEIKAVPSISCSGKNFIMPIAATNAYLDPLLYLPKITSKMLKK